MEAVARYINDKYDSKNFSIYKDTFQSVINYKFSVTHWAPNITRLFNGKFVPAKRTR